MPGFIEMVVYGGRDELAALHTRYQMVPDENYGNPLEYFRSLYQWSSKRILNVVVRHKMMDVWMHHYHSTSADNPSEVELGALYLLRAHAAEHGVSMEFQYVDLYDPRTHLRIQTDNIFGWLYTRTVIDNNMMFYKEAPFDGDPTE
jgi:hypothetical protein